ncbi:MAG: tetratricopeptide (TPR) repeat protein [Motiliproteus sp.]|jgi:tetratricopeptide (TPR) repeat protein
MLLLHCHPRRALSILGLIVLLSACAPLATPPVTTQNTPTEAQSKAPQGSFEASTLYALLVAELAAQRNLPQVTLHNYLREAERTGDLNITRHAAQLAEQYRDQGSHLKAALLWAKLEPDNPEPTHIAAAALVRLGEPERALPLLRTSLALNSLATADALSERTQKMSPAERDAYLDLIDQRLAQEPEQPQLLYTKASLLRFDSDLNPALTLIQQALDLDPEFDRAILLEADLQTRSGHLDTALGHLREQLNQRDHKQMRTLYARLLLQKGQIEAAKQQTDLLNSQYSDDINLQFYLGVLMFEHQQIELSKTYFNQLAQRLGTNSTLHYYLGRIAQFELQREAALEHFLQIDDAPYLVAGLSELGNLLNQPSDEAQLRQIYQQSRSKHPDQSALLFTLEASWLIEQDQREQALPVYNEALILLPANPQLLYNRAMLSEQLDDLEQMEQDLTQLLSLEPNNATALNALGYSLTDRTDRHQEALTLILKALRLKPEDPAILDSLGWVHYNLGDYPLALHYLLRAYDTYPDPEIASHLGQVYRKLGQPDNANRIWTEALQRDPENRQVLEAMRQAEQAP